MIDNDGNLSEAVRNGEWDKARHLAAIRVAEMMERTESPREVKALSISLSDLIDKCEANDVADEFADSPLVQILAEAEQQSRDIRAERKGRSFR